MFHVFTFRMEHKIIFQRVQIDSVIMHLYLDPGSKFVCSLWNQTNIEFTRTPCPGSAVNWGDRPLGGAVKKHAGFEAEEPLRIIVTSPRPNLPRGHSASPSRLHPSRGAILGH